MDRRGLDGHAPAQPSQAARESARLTRAPASRLAWAACLLGRVKPRLRLFCFPYAGGGTAVYRGYTVPDDVELWAIQLPGRERRISEPPIAAFSELVAGTIAGLRELLDQPYAFLGHSMGALLAYETARQLWLSGLRTPTRLIVSGHRAPHIPNPHPPTYHLPDAQFVRELARLNGTPAAVLRNPELLELLLPTIKADFQAVETYRHVPSGPLTFPITAYAGIDDHDLPRQHVEAWREHTTAEFAAHYFRGGHFYLHTARAHLLAQLARDLGET